jgi:hypothetical protein
LTEAQKAERHRLERLSKDVQRKIRAYHGSLTQAVLDGVIADGKRAVLPE